MFEALGIGLTARGYTLFEIANRPEMLNVGKALIYDGLKAGTLKPITDSIFALDDIVAAQHHMESNRPKGKIVVTV